MFQPSIDETERGAQVMLQPSIDETEISLLGVVMTNFRIFEVCYFLSAF